MMRGTSTFHGVSWYGDYIRRVLDVTPTDPTDIGHSRSWQTRTIGEGATPTKERSSEDGNLYAQYNGSNKE